MAKKKAARKRVPVRKVRAKKASRRTAPRSTAVRLRGAKPKPRIVVLFADNVNARGDDRTRLLKSVSLLGVRVIEPVFGDRSMPYMLDLEMRAQRQNPGYKWPRFGNYFFLGIPPGARSATLLREVLTLPDVRLAYLDKGTKLACTPSSPVCHLTPDHVAAEPNGIGLDAARALAGGNGEQQFLAVVERGWCIKAASPANQSAAVKTHDRLKHLSSVHLVHGASVFGRMSHGTASVGIACGIDNGIGSGCRGIAPSIGGLGLASEAMDPNENMVNPAGAVAAGLEYLKQRAGKGGVLLIETQTLDGFPLEKDHAVREAIKAAIEVHGVTVIQAAGNGSHNLDQNPDFNRSANDSGAIIVGACSSSSGHPRIGTSNFGSRVDCHAWGDFIKSPRWKSNSLPGSLDRCGYFAETSGAAAIIAGVALVLGGIAKARGIPLKPGKLRDLLRTFGTNAPGQAIGVMPDLKKILDVWPP